MNPRALPLVDVIKQCGIRDNCSVSFHHHFRDGDNVINSVMDVLADMGLKGLTLIASALLPVHGPLIKHIKSGVIKTIYTSYVNGELAKAISEGITDSPIIMQTHGGRASAIVNGKLDIDFAFIGAPSVDIHRNIYGHGKNACAPLGYARVDAFYAHHVIAVTDNLITDSNAPVDIPGEYVDSVALMQNIGASEKIVSGTTQTASDDTSHFIAKLTVSVVEAVGFLKNGLSFQAGAGGVSLAVFDFLAKRMKRNGVVGSFVSGGITGLHVEMLKQGVFKVLKNVQSFDVAAVNSVDKDPGHLSMSAYQYASFDNPDAVAHQLDVAVVGATQIDVNFNVNVTTGSDNVLRGGSGGHEDICAGSKLSIVTSKLTAGGYPKIVEKVNTLTTSGKYVDVLVTPEGISVNPRRQDIVEALNRQGIAHVNINELLRLSANESSKAAVTVNDSNPIVAVVEDRTGNIQDYVRAMTL